MICQPNYFVWKLKYLILETELDAFENTSTKQQHLKGAIH